MNMPTLEQEAPNLLKSGDRLDHYRIESLAARTALTDTFRGTDLGTGRKVAIKIPHAETGFDSLVYERFRREEKIGKRLHHPGVVRVLCDAQRSQLYLVTEWVEGRPLRAILNEMGKLSPERAVRIAVNICDALYYVHSRGVVHRDLKPENVLVISDDQIKLIDFGIAVAGGAQRMQLAKPEETAGTPDYISPEEVKGIRGDARSDIYAVGVMLFEMLSGTMPFDSCNPLLLMHARLMIDPDPIREIAPETPARLEAIICRALQRDPRKRYSSCFELARALENRETVAPSRGNKPGEIAKPSSGPWLGALGRLGHV
jgi:serine/threonine protein kinase